MTTKIYDEGGNLLGSYYFDTDHKMWVARAIGVPSASYFYTEAEAKAFIMLNAEIDGITDGDKPEFDWKMIAVAAVAIIGIVFLARR